MSVEDTHRRVAEGIEAGEARHARTRIDHVVVSYHPNAVGAMVFTAATLALEKGRLDYVKARIIDHWVAGDPETRVSPRTFSRRELEHRADQHRHGRGPGIVDGARNPAFADRIEAFAAARAGELAGEPG